MPMSLLSASSFSSPFSTARFSAQMSTSKSNAQQTENSSLEPNESRKKKIFVAGSSGRTGKKIVEKLLSEGYRVRAGALDVNKAKSTLPNDPSIDIVKADVTAGAEKLVEAIGDADAVVCATGFRYSWDIFAPWKVDNFGTVNLVEACRQIGVRRFILVSSILVNGAAMGQILNPAYIVLNVFGLTLIAKLQAENYIRKSGIDFTIVRPGGLKDGPPTGNIVMESEDTLSEGSIFREQVAEVVVGALSCPEASYKVVEIVARSEAPKLPVHELFTAINKH